MVQSSSFWHKHFQELLRHLEMISPRDLTIFDIIIIAIFLFFLIRGAWIGIIRQLAAFFALVGGYLLAAQYSDQLVPYLKPYIANPKVAFFASFGLFFLGVALTVILIGSVLHKLVKVSVLSWFNRFLGFMLGGAKAYIVGSIIFMVLGASLSSTNTLLKRSQCSSFLTQGAKLVQDVINDKELRELFTRKEPAIKNN
ncbi:MAG: CvpA family protein [Desulfobulbaceae bacterium]|nr:CvpA family protein [Desulfobulbaceae bacterium]